VATEVKIIADTISPAGKRITTFILKYPRYIHAEVMTHRCLSKNCSSSRAIPMSKIIKQVISDPVIPLHFGANQKGMAANQELKGWRYWVAKKLWLLSRWPAVGFALAMNKLGLHKQIGNRVLESWCYIHVVLTGTEWSNFYSLRCDKDHAHPDIYNLAEKMLAAQNESWPTESKYHLPFITREEKELYYCDLLAQIKISVARCCRVSYLNHDKTSSVKERDFELYDDLLKNGHMSPFEHQAVAFEDRWRISGNFKGWEQYRKTLKEEEKTSFDRLKGV
jgi:hypothetical protein